MPASASSKGCDISFATMDLNVSPRSSCCKPLLLADAPQDLASISAFAASYPHPSLDLLICNAGIMNLPFALSKVNFCPSSITRRSSSHTV